MTSIAEPELSSSSIELRDSEPRARRNFNLRAYLAGGAATAALIAGAVVVFASLAAYVAFNGLPVGSGDENASQLTIEAGGLTSPAAAGILNRAANAVAADAAARTAPGRSGSGNRNGSGNNPSGGPPSGGPTDPAPPTGPPTVGTTPAPGAGTSGGGTGAVGGAVNGVSNATGLPLSGPTQGVTNAADDALHQVNDTVSAPQLTQPAQGAVDGLTGDLGL
jgi:hypothetical protein